MNRKEVEHVIGYLFFAGLVLIGMWMGSLLLDAAALTR